MTKLSFFGRSLPSPFRRAAGSSRAVTRTWRNLRRLSGHERLVVARILGLLGVAEIGLRLQPLPTVARWFQVPLSTVPTPVPTERAWERLTAAERGEVEMARRVAARWPFGQGPCLRLSLVEGHVLRSRHPVLRLGVANSGPAIVAHAWIEVDGRPLDEPGEFLPFEIAES
jgi:hypothetical protein